MFTLLDLCVSSFAREVLRVLSAFLGLGSKHVQKGLRDRNSPTCTLSQNGYGDKMSWSTSCPAKRSEQGEKMALPKSVHYWTLSTHHTRCRPHPSPSVLEGLGPGMVLGNLPEGIFK